MFRVFPEALYPCFACFTLSHSSLCNMYQWTLLMEDHPEWTDLIQPGLDKLEDYQERLVDTRAYLVAMGKIIHIQIDRGPIPPPHVLISADQQGHFSDQR